MEPYPTNAVAVQWEFSCRGSDKPEGAWGWRCRSKEGAILAASHGCFRSLRDALADAKQHGFSVHAPPEEP
jgi:hypothetical protein